MKSKIKALLYDNELTIPQICNPLNIDNEFAVMRAVAKLQCLEEVVLTGFDKIYREDGGAIYLAKYVVRHK